MLTARGYNLIIIAIQGSNRLERYNTPHSTSACLPVSSITRSCALEHWVSRRSINRSPRDGKHASPANETCLCHHRWSTGASWGCILIFMSLGLYYVFCLQIISCFPSMYVRNGIYFNYLFVNVCLFVCLFICLFLFFKFF